MATYCRKDQAQINRHRLMRFYARTILVALVLFGGVMGFLIGRHTVPEKTLTLTQTIEVPVYNANSLPDVADVFLFNVPLSDSVQRYIYEVCTDKGVPVTLVLAMIEHESGFNPEAVSATNDCGLMQINSINYERLEKTYHCADMMNPYQNIFCGVSIISSYVEKYDGDYTKALMAYNMGDYGAKKAWDNGVTSTRYSKEILTLMAGYEEEFYAKSN